MMARPIGWVAAALALFVSAGIASTRPLGYDLMFFVAAARRLRAGESLYPGADHVPLTIGPGGVDYVYEPVTAVLFVPLSLLPDDAVRAVWAILLVALAAAVGYALTRSIAADRRPWAVAAYALYLPLVAEITIGNLNLVTLSLCLLAWRLRARPALGGTALAVAVGLKLMPLALPLFFLAAGAWRVVVWAGAIGAGVVAVSLLPLAGDWKTFIRLAPEIASTPVATVIPLIPTDAAVRAGLAAVSLALSVAMGRVARDDARAWPAYAIALSAVPLPAPVISYPYLVFALPLLAALTARGSRLVLAVTAVAWLMLEIPTRPGSPPIAFAGLALCIALGVMLVARPGRAAPAPVTA